MIEILTKILLDKIYSIFKQIINRKQYSDWKNLFISKKYLSNIALYNFSQQIFPGHQ